MTAVLRRCAVAMTVTAGAAGLAIAADPDLGRPASVAPPAAIAPTPASPPADLAAIGLVSSARGERSAAILRSGGRDRIVGLGESAFGGRVVAIGASGVRLVFGGQPVDLALTGPAPARAARATRNDPREDPSTPARSMSRTEVERRLGAEIPRILAETALVPSADGFTLARIPEGTLLSDAGLRAGDVLASINDTPIDSLATLMALWPRLQGEQEIRAVVLRGGQRVSLSVSLR